MLFTHARIASIVPLNLGWERKRQMGQVDTKFTELAPILTFRESPL
jgi:hypothetical protein